MTGAHACPSQCRHVLCKKAEVSGWGRSILACLEVAGDLPLEEEGRGYVFGSTRSHAWLWFSLLSAPWSGQSSLLVLGTGYA